MKKLIFLTLISWPVIGITQDLYVGETSFEEIESPYLIVELYVFPRYRAGRIAVGTKAYFRFPDEDGYVMD